MATRATCATILDIAREHGAHALRNVIADPGVQKMESRQKGVELALAMHRRPRL